MPFLNDKSEAGVERWMVASRAFERSNSGLRFANAIDHVQEHWLAMAEAAIEVVRETAKYKTMYDKTGRCKEWAS